MKILIADPNREESKEDSISIKNKLENIENIALILFRKGHIPLIGEWVALSILNSEGSNEIENSILYPFANQSLGKCDAVFRIEGASNVADNDIKIAKESGLKIYYSLDELPNLTQK